MFVPPRSPSEPAHRLSLKLVRRYAIGGNPNAVGLSAVSNDMAKVRTFEDEATLQPLIFGSRNNVQ